jgi:RNA polymerase sigma-70 factor, ECF subfamily
MNRHRPLQRTRDTEEWFSQLYQQTNQDLLAFLLRRCANTEDAADCLAETYRITWEKRDHVPPGDEIRPWLFGVARNVLRRENHTGRRDAALCNDLAVALERSTASTEAPATKVAESLSVLSDLDREIITMIAWDRLTPREVATVLDLSPNVVRIRASRARQRLRTHLAQRGVDSTAAS